MDERLRLKISLLPETPGVYRYYNSEGTIIYVGKAKNLKRRVSSYFNREHEVERTNRLVSNIADMEYTVVNTEEEALDLENNLIKEYQPKYNVLLKDDKSYPWICVTKELYPRVFITREKVHRGALFFGPYPKAEIAHTLVTALHQIFPIRTCRHNVSRETIEAKKHRLCLQYHIKNCEGCCQGLVSADQYAQYIEQIKGILNGDTKLVAEHLQEEMMTLAGELKFEEAEVTKRKLMLLEKLRTKSCIVSPTVHNIDVFAINIDDDTAYVNFMHVRNGSVVQSLTLEYKTNTHDDEATPQGLMSLAISEIRHRFATMYQRDRIREVVVNVLPDVESEGVEYVIPQRGDKRKLLDIAIKNALQRKQDRLKMMEKLNPEQRATRTMTTMMRDLHLDTLPRHIECFDNSNIQGSDAVASCVVFRNGKPSKKEYRHYIIKTAAGNDDFDSMREVITRRVTRLREEGQELPHLIVVDGGKGQLTAAIDALEAIGEDSIAVVGLAKRMDEIFFPGDELPFNIDRNSETLRVIQRLRDESHRFAITFHRKRRSKSQVHSALDSISGIGPKTKELLLKHFKSVKRIREATVEELAAVIGTAKAAAVTAALNANTDK